jgi:hypothetical protein
MKGHRRIDFEIAQPVRRLSIAEMRMRGEILARIESVNYETGGTVTLLQ